MNKILPGLFFIFLLTGCFSYRPPLPIGHIPEQKSVLTEDEQYGHEVLSQISERYPLDDDDARIQRVRDIVEKITKVNNNDQNIWHVYVLKDTELKNAAATKGNYIFVWSPLVDYLDNDNELATVLSHEIAHVLAKHVQPEPAILVNQTISQVAGNTTRQILYGQGGAAGALAGIADLIIQQTLNAALINPQKQRLELEADQIGLFLMAEAGYNPEAAITFWNKAVNDPQLSGSTLEFLSSHPSSEERLKKLESYLPEAVARYKGEPLRARNIESKSKPQSSKPPESVRKTPKNKRDDLVDW